MNKDVISTPNAPAAVGPYSQGIRVGGDGKIEIVRHQGVKLNT